ncbi:MAG: hypothetical protein BGO48_07010 [Mucilaginibacter sp. 44-25]|nr:MAG: hypothetical protein BGO48_07010 [Mucilaginibacter sp. 44-25]
MNICYQCGQQMVTEAYYNQNKSQFTAEPRFNHNEHIIQNALYGRLKPDHILCKQCGNEYSTAIDKDFVSLFQIITERVKDQFINKDHGKDSSNTMKGYLFDPDDPEKKRDVQVRDNVVTPKDPFYEYDDAKQTVYIYANKIRAKQYQPIVEKELTAKGININYLTFEVIDDASSLGVLGIFFSEGVENFHQKFTLGFCKIAVGFATYCGIDRSELPHALKIDASGKGELISKNNIYPFFPIGSVDSQLELGRPDIERHYPSHTLILFSQTFAGGSKKLFCYVDLFSTFQYYVLLNDNYTGQEVYQNYHQALVKQIKERQDVRKTRHKYLNILIDDFQIDTKKFIGSTSDMEAYLDFLQAEVDKYSFDPGIDLKVEIYRMLDHLMQSYIAAASGLFSTPTIENLDNLPDVHREAFLAELNYYFERNEDGIEFYRKNFLEDDGHGDLETMSAPLECIHQLTTNEARRVYCTMKFNQMSNWISESLQANNSLVAD